MTTKTKSTLAATLAVASVCTIPLALQWQEISRLESALATTNATPRAAAGPPGEQLQPTALPAATADRITLLGKIINDPDTNQVARLREVIQVIEKLGPEEIRDLLDNFNQMPLSDQASWTKYSLLSRWAELDPPAALAWAKAQTLGNGRTSALVMMFDAWAAKDPAAALAALDQVNDSAARSQILLNTLARIATRDPEAALAAASRLPVGQQSSYGIVFYVWGRNNPAAATAALLNLPPSGSRNQAAQMLAYGWAQLDPHAALAWAKTLPPGSARFNALNSVLAPTEPQFSAANIDSVPPGSVRNGQIVGTATNLAAQDPAAALAWVERVATGQTHDQAVQRILAQVGQNDPAAAAAFLAHESDPAIRNAAIPQLATAWAEKDIQGALAWVQGLPAAETDLRSSAFKNVLKSWTTTDPATAAVYIQQNLADDPNFSALTGQVAGNWAAADPRAALAWAETLPAGAGQDGAVRGAIAALANLDPQSAWGYAQQLPAGGNREQALGNVVASWSGQDAAQAAALLGGLSAGATRDTATAKVAENWIKQDPLAASQWVSTLPTGDARDGAIVSLINGEWGNDMPAAFTWAGSITKDSLRQVVLEAVTQEWAKRDAVAATNGILAAKLTEQQQADLLKAVQKGDAAK